MTLEPLKQRRFWSPLLHVIRWGGPRIFAKLGSIQLPPEASRFLFAWGDSPVALVPLASLPSTLRKNPNRIFYSAPRRCQLSRRGPTSIWRLLERYKFVGHYSYQRQAPPIQGRPGSSCSARRVSNMQLAIASTARQQGIESWLL